MDQLNVLEDGKKDALNIDIRETKDEENQIEFGLGQKSEGLL